MVNDQEISFQRFVLLIEALKEIELEIKINDTYENGSRIGLKYFLIFYNNKLEALIPSKMKNYINQELETYKLMNNSLKIVFLSLIKDASSFEKYLLQLIKYAEVLNLEPISVVTIFISNTSNYLTDEEEILSYKELGFDLENWKLFTKFLDNKYGFNQTNNTTNMFSENISNFDFTSNNYTNKSILFYDKKIKLPLKTSTPKMSQISLYNSQDFDNLSNVIFESTIKNSQSYIKKEETSFISCLENDDNLMNILKENSKTNNGKQINDIKGKISSFFMENPKLNVKYKEITQKNQYNSIIHHKQDGKFYLEFYKVNNRHGFIYHFYGFSNNVPVNGIVKRTTKAKEFQTTKMLSILSILNTTEKYGLKSIMIFHSDKTLHEKIKDYEKSLNATENLVYKKIKEISLHVEVFIILINEEVKIEEMELILFTSMKLIPNIEFEKKNYKSSNVGLPLCIYL
ncbi:Hypothetical protein SRAE_2000526200 [Strongyloides ratti]|uniref:Uncharacterized protein n=1 Tax=Strongyloides ratti TaxID=34506 RepID=A0A090LR37_STRRB|nr:Hypothetical protein SRAE_2000526200 [Strongyloides ratti]CEF70637.1 Hypothetical protein SRAE_2000526200 [Strongyloides ratti]